MGKRISEKSLFAILFACVWIFCTLCLSAPRPAQKAHADSLMDREIYIMATDLDNPSGGSVIETYNWGTFYHGVGVLSDVLYQPGGNGQGGTITWDEIDNDSGEVFLTISDTDDPLYNHGHHHNFISTDIKDFEPIDEHTHWAVCPDCGFKLQVAHRPDNTGTCKDCGDELGDNYLNDYTFTIPEEIPFEEAEWIGDDPPQISFIVNLEAKLYAGVLLKLLMQCENGEFLSEYGETVGYTISVFDESGGTGSEALKASDLKDEPQVIWELTVDDDIDGDLDDTGRKVISIEITITLEVITEDEAELTYSGACSDTLTFSAELTEESA